MKKVAIAVALLFATKFASFSQNVDDKLFSIKGKWAMDENKNVTIHRIIEVPNLSKEEIYQKTLNFLTHHYIGDKFKIVNSDKTDGIILGNGVFDRIHYDYRGWHAVKIDIKDGKARIVLTMTEYEYQGMTTPTDFNTPWLHSKVSDEIPVNPKGGKYIFWGNAFYAFFTKSMETVDGLENALKNAITSKEFETTNWK